MNPKGTKRNLKASHPENTNAEETGLYSERRRDEKARAVRANLDEDPQATLDDDLRNRYARLEGLSELLHEYLIEHGVTDRHGK
ncbi:MAG TPA: hypothetical protein VKE27_11615, partial [Candidatus Dormibacteraeota bacterium]|nr:hypothetical protein [Candidatus Dormibacteraeota bacterium]